MTANTRTQQTKRVPSVANPTGQVAETVWGTTYDLLRSLGLTTIFGNPGSTEQSFLKNFPADFRYVLGLQEASVVAMADGFAQATHQPVLVNLHTCAGTGNAMAGITAAFLNQTPLIITAGQQTRDMLLYEPFLTNRDETMVPRPYVKWAYQPTRAQDVPGAIMRAYAMALQPPAGPVYLSIPLDDWDQPALGPIDVRTVSVRVAPDPDRIREFSRRITAANRLALIYGQEIVRSKGWDAGVALAEKLRAPVFHAPLTERPAFPETHPLFQGMLPMAIGPLGERLRGFDLAVVVGAPVFRYYPYVPGSILPPGCELLQVTNDPHDAACAAAGDSLLADSKLALEALLQLAEPNSSRVQPKPLDRPRAPTSTAGAVLTASELYAALSEMRPPDAIVVQESPSNAFDLALWWPTVKPDAYYTNSVALGWGAPAAVGIALAQQHGGAERPVVAFIGDGSFQYSVQCLATAAQYRLKVIFVVPCNGEYAVLKDLSVLENTPNMPGLDLPELDIVSTAKGFGCSAFGVNTKEDLQAGFTEAMRSNGPTVLAVPIQRQRHLWLSELRRA
jgi:benzoylformate decarboxylase